MKRKIYLELGITLVIGFLIGFFANSIITDRRIKDYSVHKEEWAFWRRALVEVEATEEQREAIRAIVHSYSEETREILHRSWEQIPPMWDKMNKAVKGHLTPEQQKQIEEIQRERKKQMRAHMKRQRDRSGDRRHEGRQKQDRRAKENIPPPPHEQ